MKKIIIILLLVAAIMAVFVLTDSTPETDNALYVSVKGNDQNDGTKSKPFRTLEKAALEAEAGTTVYIRKGTYHEKLIVQHSGIKLKPVIFRAYKKEEVVLSGTNAKGGQAGISSLVTINDKNYVTIHGLTLQDIKTDVADETVVGIYVTGSSSHITLENNHVRRIETHAEEGNAHGIAIYGTGPMKDIKVINNTVENLKLGSSEALVLNGNIDGFKVESNLVRRSDNIGIDLIGHEGISNDEKADFVRNGVVKNNTVYEISSYGNPAYGEDYSAGGIYIDGGKNITLEENIIYKCDIGIEAASEHAGKYAEQVIIINNIIYDNFYTGISIGGYDEKRGGTINSTISQNVIYRNDTKGLNGGQLLLQHDTKNNVIEKNILTAGPSRLFIANYFSTNHKNKLKKNVFHKEKGKTGFWVWKEEEYTAFPEFISASNSDTQSIYADPKFKHEDKYDFRLKKGSPAKKNMK